MCCVCVRVYVTVITLAFAKIASIKLVLETAAPNVVFVVAAVVEHLSIIARSFVVAFFFSTASNLIGTLRVLRCNHQIKSNYY